MEQKIRLILFIKIVEFIFSTWICHFNNNLRLCNESLNNKFNLDRKSYTSYYRSLAKYKQKKDSNILGLREDIPNNLEHKKRNISNSENRSEGRNKKSNGSLLNKAQYYSEVVDYNNGMFDGKHFHFEKKWIKKKDYDNFLQKKRRICDITLKKIKFKNYGFGVAIFLFFFLLGILLPTLRGFEMSLTKVKRKEKQVLLEFIEQLKTLTKLEEGHIYLILFGVLMIILSILVIITIYKILKNNEKYNKIKLMTE
ncbi:uncharacterized protein MKS88_000185 [Plasmodium brasilianum]|uniref:uncharacterized protein n=1 Tax=Plasmodium brasilianum TaxID=5824 RepID=UPI00350E450A|nr:hypothetical protein MKS88_000185 [Plasmodium brasilianum]